MRVVPADICQFAAGKPCHASCTNHSLSLPAASQIELRHYEYVVILNNKVYVLRYITALNHAL